MAVIGAPLDPADIDPGGDAPERHGQIADDLLRRVRELAARAELLASGR